METLKAEAAVETRESNADDSPESLLVAALVDAMMAHAATDGAVDYPKAAAAMARCLAEMIGPQSLSVRKSMLADFRSCLDVEVQRCALRHSVINGGKS